MSDSDESIDSLELELQLLVDEYKDLLKEYIELKQQNQMKPRKQEISIENFELQWKELQETKTTLEDKIEQIYYQSKMKQEELEEQQDKLLIIKEQIFMQNNQLQEKEQLVKLLQKQLKDM